MKKILLFLLSISLVFGMAGAAGATIIIEEWSGSHEVSVQGWQKPVTLYWDFDLLDMGPTGGTDSDLSLTTDGIILEEDLEDVESVYIRFSDDSYNDNVEYANIMMSAGGETLFTEALMFDVDDGSPYTFVHDFTSYEIGLLMTYGGEATLSLVAPPKSTVNSYFINKVGVGQNAAPEPTTMFLLGFGMIGLAGVHRKRSFRK